MEYVTVIFILPQILKKKRYHGKVAAQSRKLSFKNLIHRLKSKNKPGSSAQY